MCIVMSEFINERFIHKSVRSYIHAVEIQTERQSTTSAALKRGGTTYMGRERESERERERMEEGKHQESYLHTHTHAEAFA